MEDYKVNIGVGVRGGRIVYTMAHINHIDRNQRVEGTGPLNLAGNRLLVQLVRQCVEQAGGAVVLKKRTTVKPKPKKSEK